MYCCPNCFNHAFIKNFIKSNFSKTGQCAFCTSNSKQALLDPSLLIDLFQPILDLYIQSTAGLTLNLQLQKDWKIFNTIVTDVQQKKLLAIITSDRALASIKVVSRYTNDNNYINKWECFKEELQYKNRFFPKNAIDTTQLKDLLVYLAIAKGGNPPFIYRARVNRTLEPFDVSEMGKPPKEKALDGRANPKGIPYFYGASDQKTAIAETRPYKSEIVNVATFKLSRKTKIIDIRSPKLTISPFGLDDDSLGLLYREHMPFLEHLGEALSIPVLPHKKDLEYLPTQYLCELIKDINFHGITFKSSLGKGDNYVIFDDTLLTGIKVDLFRIEDTVINPVKITK